MGEKRRFRKAFLGIVLTCFLMFLGVARPMFTRTLAYTSTPFQDGEILSYKIRWGFIRVGTLEISQSLIGSSSPDSSVNLPTITDFELKDTDLFFIGEREDIEVSVYGRPGLLDTGVSIFVLWTSPVWP